MMVFSLVIIRNLSDELVAEYGFAQGLLRLFAPYIGFSLGFHLITTSALLVERLYATYFFITFVFSIVSLSLLVFILSQFGLLSDEFTIFMVVLCCFTMSKVIYELKRSQLRALLSFKKLNIFNIRISFLLLVSSFLAFWNVEVAIITCSLLIIFLSSSLKAPKLPIRYFWIIIRKTLPISVSSSVSLVLISSDLILLKFLGASTQVSANYYLNQFILFTFLTIPSLVYVFFFESFKTKTRNLELEKFSQKLSFWGIFIACILVFVFYDFIFAVLLQKSVSFSALLFFLFATSVITNGSIRMYLANRFTANGKSTVILYNSIISATSNLVLSVMLWFPFREIGIAAGTLLTILISSIYLYLEAKK